jgi:hypothetical protein
MQETGQSFGHKLMMHWHWVRSMNGSSMFVHWTVRFRLQLMQVASQAHRPVVSALTHA